MLLCPWDSPGKYNGVGCHFFSRGSSRPRDQNPHLFCLPHWQVGSLPLAPPSCIGKWILYHSCHLPALASGFFTTRATWEAPGHTS